MIHVKDINKVTGYIRGGCSPLGMKKIFKTFIQENALLFDTIVFSGGKIGSQIEMNPNDLKKAIECSFVDIIKTN
ncbi:Cys-tRNA(Pro) deacylase [Clostridium beijerinckii]|nr:Cys-tRNA(Pro) deacylase [Clostridium beijerinckii]